MRKISALLFVLLSLGKSTSSQSLIYSKNFNVGITDNEIDFKVNTSGLAFHMRTSLGKLSIIKTDLNGWVADSFSVYADSSVPNNFLATGVICNDYTFVAFDKANTIYKFSPAGALLWKIPFKVSLAKSFSPQNLKVLADNSILISGSFTLIPNPTSLPNNGSFFSRLDESGDMSWIIFPDTSLRASYNQRAIELKNGNLIFAYNRVELQNESNYEKILYCANSKGAILWGNLFDIQDRSDFLRGLSEDHSGNIISVNDDGFEAGIGNTEYSNVRISKYNSTGSLIFTKVIFGQLLRSPSMAFDKKNNILATFVDNCSDPNNGCPPPTSYILALKAGNGSLIFKKYLNTFSSSPDSGAAAICIKTESNGNFYVGGYIAYHNVVRKYSSSGNIIWSISNPAQNSFTKSIEIVKIGKANHLFCSGFKLNFTPAGYLVYEKLHFSLIVDGPINCSIGKTRMCDHGTSLCVLNSDTSTYFNSGASYGNCIGLRYENSLVNQESTDSNYPIIYPNPARSFISIKIDSETEQVILFKIYDSQGNIANCYFQTPSKIDISKLSNGIYFYQLKTNISELKVGKFIVDN